MQFLGNLGIDMRMLIAQMINFALLVWLLSYLVYKPTVKLIEENEAELEEGRKRKKALEDEKLSFAAEKEKELSEIRDRTMKSADEIKAMTETLRSRTNERIDRESVAIIAQTRQALELEKPMLEKELTDNLKAGFTERFTKSFDDALEPRYREELEGVLLKSLIDKIESAPLEALPPSELKALRKLGRTDQEAYRRKLEKRFGIVTMEYASAVSIMQRKEVEAAVAKKIGLKMPVRTRQNKSLINGLRLEISGMIIESTLSDIIKHAEKN